MRSTTGLNAGGCHLIIQNAYTSLLAENLRTHTVPLLMDLPPYLQKYQRPWSNPHKFSRHHAITTAKATQLLNLFRRTFPKKPFHILYSTYIRPILEYGSVTYAKSKSATAGRHETSLWATTSTILEQDGDPQPVPPGCPKTAR